MIKLVAITRDCRASRTEPRNRRFPAWQIRVFCSQLLCRMHRACQPLAWSTDEARLVFELSRASAAQCAEFALKNQIPLHAVLQTAFRALLIRYEGHLAGPSSATLKDLLHAAPSSPVTENDVIAYFPQALHWDPESPLLQSSFHDVPLDEPDLVSELLRTPWPDRSLLARITDRIRQNTFRDRSARSNGSAFRLRRDADARQRDRAVSQRSCAC